MFLEHRMNIAHDQAGAIAKNIRVFDFAVSVFRLCTRYREKKRHSGVEIYGEWSETKADG